MMYGWVVFLSSIVVVVVLPFFVEWFISHQEYHIQIQRSMMNMLSMRQLRSLGDVNDVRMSSSGYFFSKEHTQAQEFSFGPPFSVRMHRFIKEYIYICSGNTSEASNQGRIPFQPAINFPCFCELGRCEKTRNYVMLHMVAIMQ